MTFSTQIAVSWPMALLRVEADYGGGDDVLESQQPWPALALEVDYVESARDGVARERRVQVVLPDEACREVLMITASRGGDAGGRIHEVSVSR